MIKQRILITDDDEDDTEILTEALFENNYRGELEVFRNGKELIEHLKKDDDKNIPVILLDLNMPIMNGYETLKILKSDNRLEKYPVIIFTSSLKTDDERYCKELGCNEYLTKPFSLSEYENIALKIISFLPQ